MEGHCWGKANHSCPSLAQVPQLGFDPSHRSLRFLHTTQAIRFGRGTSPPSLLPVPLGLEELPVFMPARPKSWSPVKSSSSDAVARSLSFIFLRAEYPG